MNCGEFYAHHSCHSSTRHCTIRACELNSLIPYSQMMFLALLAAKLLCSISECSSHFEHFGKARERFLAAMVSTLHASLLAFGTANDSPSDNPVDAQMKNACSKQRFSGFPAWQAIFNRLNHYCCKINRPRTIRRTISSENRFRQTKHFLHGFKHANQRGTWRDARIRRQEKSVLPFFQNETGNHFPERSPRKPQAIPCCESGGWNLFCRAAGIKNCRAFFRRKAGQFNFLEQAGWHGWNPHPVSDNLRREFARLANFSIS